MTDIMMLASPPNWQLYRLGQLFRERKEKGSDKDFPPLSVTMRGIVPQLETAAKTDDGDNRKVVRVGDYVINSRSDRKGSGGISDHEGSVSLISIVLQPRSIDPRFAHHLLRSPAFQEEFYRWGHGIVADLWTTRYADMKNIRLRVPNLSTQREIADFLDRETARIDLLIEKKQKLVVLLGEKIAAKQQSDIDDLLNIFGPSRLKNFTLSITTGPFGSAIKQDEYVEGGIPILNPAHIAKGRIIPDMSVTLSDEKSQELQYWRLKPGDVLMGRRGDLGRCAVVDKELGDSICGTGCLRLRVHPKHNPSYVYLIVSSRRSREWLDLNAVGTTMKNLNEAIVGRLPIPAVRREQQDKFIYDIQNAHHRNTAVSTKIMASIDRLNEYRSALITAAVTGQIDVTTYAKSGVTDRRLDAIEEEMGA